MIRLTAPSALDPNLAQVIDDESQGRKLPLAIERSKEHIGAPRVIDAIDTAVKKLLDSYVDARPGRIVALPISVSNLCEIAGVDLVGLPLASASTRKVRIYGLNSEVSRKKGHTGLLQLGRTRPIIRIPPGIDRDQARVSAAHEIGHLLVHQRGNGLDLATVKMGSSREEEAIVEYASRLLLMPKFSKLSGPQVPLNAASKQLPLIPDHIHRPSSLAVWAQNVAKESVVEAERAEVTIHSAVARMGDPDRRVEAVHCAILWRLNGRVSPDAPVWQRLTPQWHLSNSFIPIGKCGARSASLVADLAAQDIPAEGSRVEDVAIGGFVGKYRIDAFAWGTLTSGTRWCFPFSSVQIEITCLDGQSRPIRQVTLLRGSSARSLLDGMGRKATDGHRRPSAKNREFL